nr:MAG TPA: hypothetical protein [Caudoviricetes sp.]
MYIFLHYVQKYILKDKYIFTTFRYIYYNYICSFHSQV